MSQAVAPGDAVNEARGYRVTLMFHPSHHVLDLNAAEEWFERVFHRRSTALASLPRDRPPRPGAPVDYSTFTPISDVLFDSIDPLRYVLLGVQRYASVERPHLKSIGWYIDGMTELYHELRRRGIRVVDQLDQVAEGEDPPTAATSPALLFFTSPQDTGLRYELFPAMPFPLDPRPGEWTTPPVSDEDPLGIEHCASHTILTDEPQRATSFVVDVLGGQIIHGGRNELFGTTSTYVHLAGSILEFGVPDEGTLAHRDWQQDGPEDTYYSIAWKVRDLARVEQHLRAEGVTIRSHSEHTIVTDPTTSLGVPWAFTSTLVPGDPR